MSIYQCPTSRILLLPIEYPLVILGNLVIGYRVHRREWNSQNCLKKSQMKKEKYQKIWETIFLVSPNINQRRLYVIYFISNDQFSDKNKDKSK